MAVVIYGVAEDDVAHLPGVRRYIVGRTNAAAGKAKAKLAAHKGKSKSNRKGPHSKIEHWVGDTDGHVALVDPGGAALQIEKGTSKWRGVHALEGIW